jgi:hypothetical protein
MIIVDIICYFHLYLFGRIKNLLRYYILFINSILYSVIAYKNYDELVWIVTITGLTFTYMT